MTLAGFGIYIQFLTLLKFQWQQRHVYFSRFNSLAPVRVSFIVETG